ncbi:MAG: Ldh family oxidoreductase [Clostridia bacterium]|nr:Ldh family oxidoreductase [Clostridia bacterium]
MSDFYLPFDTAEKFMSDAFTAIGVPADEAKICAEVLIESDKRGIFSHGMNRFKPIYIDRINIGIQNVKTNFEIVRETPTTAVIDGHDGMGHVISHRAMNMAIDKALEYGMGMVSVRNSTHYGIAGYYASMATEKNCIGITGTNARPSIAPTFGVENMLGTNPLTVGFPTDEPFDFMLDCATSIMQRGKIEVFNRVGQDTPAGVVTDRQGNVLVDSKEILEKLTTGNAALAPLGGFGEDTGGYKGYGYATVVEILSAALAAGSFLKSLRGLDKDGNRVPYHLGHFFIAINTEAFVGADSFRKTTGDILRELRNSQKAPDQERIYTAGEKEYLFYQENKDKGVQINKSLQGELSEVRDMFNLDYHFPWEE